MLSLIKHTLVADGTNPICKHFKLGRHMGSAGPEMVWRIYEATRMSDGYVSKSICLLLFSAVLGAWAFCQDPETLPTVYSIELNICKLALFTYLEIGCEPPVKRLYSI